MRPRLSTAVLVVSAQLAGLPAVGQTAWPAPPKPPAPAWPQAPGSASAPAPAPVTAQTMPANAAELDTLLATKQYAQIGQIMRQASTPTAVTINLNWQREKVFAGASAFVAFTYANDLWRMAEVIPPEHGAELKNTAVVAALYTVALIAIDGVKCQDVSAPVHRRDQIFTAFPHIWKHAQTLPAEKRTYVVQAALRLEQRTAAHRADDDFLCRDGLDQMQDALQKNAGKPLQEAPPGPGQIGKQILVPAAPDYQPKFHPRDTWLPKQTEARAAISKALPEMMEKLAAPKP